MWQYLFQHLPNIISLIRILMAPILLYLALKQYEIIFMSVLIFTVLTDAIDGYIARRMNLVSALGAQLDSWGDFVIYRTMMVSAWLLWPNIVRHEQYYIMIIVASFTLPVLIGLIRFQKLTSYHTLSVKCAVGLTIAAYVLLFTMSTSWPVKLAAMCCIYAGLEQIFITLLNQQQNTIDIKSIWHVLKVNKTEKN
jgi:CDP-diacylglycerol--glycerol-3-phosphate 3-phosphatidyltransferase